MVWKPGLSWHQRQSMSITLVRLLNSIVFRSIFSASSTFQSRDFRYLTMLREREKVCKCYYNTRIWRKFLLFASIYNITYVESLGKKSSSPSIGGTSFILSFSDCIFFSMLTKISQTRISVVSTAPYWYSVSCKILNVNFKLFENAFSFCS